MFIRVQLSHANHHHEVFNISAVWRPLLATIGNWLHKHVEDFSLIRLPVLWQQETVWLSACGAWHDESRLTLTSQDEVLVLVHVLLDKVTAGSEGLSAVRVSTVGLLGELKAGHTLWDVLHPLFAARLQRTVTLSCTHRHTVICLFLLCRLFSYIVPHSTPKKNVISQAQCR